MGLTQNLGLLSTAIKATSTLNVGLGTASPNQALDVVRSSGAVYLGTTSNSIDFLHGVDAAGLPRLFTSGANAISIWTNSLERLRVTSGGNVGIGTNSPSDYSGHNTLHINGKSGALGGVLRLTSFNGVSGVNMYTDSGGINFNTTTSSPFIWYQQDVERMRITSAGQTLINGSSPTAAGISSSGTLQVFKEIFSGGTLAGIFWENRSATATSNSNWYGWYTASNTIYLYAVASGNIGNFNTSTGNYTATSDINRKKDLESYTNSGLDAILGLKPTLYRMKTEDESTEKHLGFIAQEVKDFIPQAYVETIADEKYGGVHIGIDYQAITVNLVKAIQELKAEIDQLKAK